MTPAVRITDVQDPCIDIGGSSDVLINNLGAHRFTDVDTCNMVQITASEDTFANNLGMARVADLNSVNLLETTGSSDTFIN